MNEKVSGTCLCWLITTERVCLWYCWKWKNVEKNEKYQVPHWLTHNLNWAAPL